VTGEQKAVRSLLAILTLLAAAASNPPRLLVFVLDGTAALPAVEAKK